MDLAEGNGFAGQDIYDNDGQREGEAEGGENNEGKVITGEMIRPDFIA